MRVSELNFSAHNTFQPVVGTREFGTTVPSADTLATAKPAEAGEGFFKRMICCIPRCLTALVQKLICVLTFGCYCNPKPLSEKEQRKVLIENAEALWKVWSGAEAPEKKKEAAEAFYQKHPEAKAAIAEVGANNDRDASFNLKPPTNAAEAKATEKLIKDWNEKGRAESLAIMIEALDRYDSTLLFSYIKNLRMQNEQEKK